MRLGLVPAWIFLISAEAIASTGGLGYRIFLVRRYLAMDVIIPYVAWITLLAYSLDRMLLPLLAPRLPLGASRRKRPMSFVDVAGVAVRYDGMTILADVNLKVEEGAFVTIVGPSGCGKSTFLRLLLSQEQPTDGSIWIGGTPLPDRPTPTAASSSSATRSSRISRSPRI